MKDTDYSKPPIKPTLKMFTPYKQTVVGFFVVVLLVALLILLVQLLMWI